MRERIGSSYIGVADQDGLNSSGIDTPQARNIRPLRHPFNSIDVKLDLRTNQPRVYFRPPPDAADLKFQLDTGFNRYVARGETQGMYYEVLGVLHPTERMTVIKEQGNGEEIAYDVKDMLEGADTSKVVESLRETRLASCKLVVRETEEGETKERKRGANTEATVNEKIAAFLLREKGRMVTAEELVVAGWGESSKDLITTYYNSLYVAICKLRRALAGDFAVCASKDFYTRYFAILPSQILEATKEGDTLRIGYPGFEDFVKDLPLDPAIGGPVRKLASFEVRTDSQPGNPTTLDPRIFRKQLTYLLGFLISDRHEISLDELRIFTSSKHCEFRDEDVAQKDEPWRKRVTYNVSFLRDRIRDLNLPITIESTSRSEQGGIQSYQLRAKD